MAFKGFSRPGMPKSPSLAEALARKRGGKEMLSRGGPVEDLEDDDDMESMPTTPSAEPEEYDDPHFGNVFGGTDFEDFSQEPPEEEERPTSLGQALMKRRRMMKGGRC